ncbi:MAG: D-aminoacylase [Verrucomicrobia bacterium]|nr:D-aminoacylase [Verrucomicrobiota bacterium]
MSLKKLFADFLFPLGLGLLVVSCASPGRGPGGARHDVVIQNGTIYDGSGGVPFVGTVAIRGDRISYLGAPTELRGKTVIDATGKAVSPGFINMLSWTAKALRRDGKSQGDIRQGVTLEVLGEGSSLGPLNATMRRRKDGTDVPWTTLGQGLEHLVGLGVSPNIASFVGATTLRVHEVGYENRPATEAELERMQALARAAMEEGAVGISTALIYAPADYASTEELVRLAKAVAEYDGLYISHMRSEGSQLLEALDELFNIAREAGIRSEIYHLKASRRGNWHKLDELIRRVEQAQKDGLQITADMYTYNASSTGLTGVIPTWVQEGGHEAWMNRMREPEARKRLLGDLREQLANQPPEGIMMVGFENEELGKKFMGKTVAEAARIRGQSPEDAIIDLVLEDNSRIQCVYISMSMDNIRKKIALPWVSFCSDSASLDPANATDMTHPRAYGSFARVLGKFSRDEKIISLREAIRRLTSFPAANLKIRNRGSLKEGYFADVVVFDPETVTDHATFKEPHQFSTGVAHVFVNGVQVLKDGEHTGAKPGRVVRGPGWKGHRKSE